MFVLDHVALVVERLESALERLEGCGLEVGPTETFPGEGTREVYVGASRRGALLLMEPLGDEGPYARALQRRGPGLHHVAFNVASIPQSVDALGGSGWCLHLRSLETFASSQTVWLTRPGVGALIELHASTAARALPAAVSAVEIPVGGTAKPLLEAFGCAEVRRALGQEAWLEVGGVRVRADVLGRA